MKRKGLRVVALALGLGMGGTAMAAQKQDRGDLNVFLRGGVSGYTGDLAELTEAGPAWGVTVNIQPFTFLGFEVGYEGSRHNAETGFPESPVLLRNGASTLLKVSPPFIQRVRPFVGAGLGASYISARGAVESGYRSDLMEEIPLAAGVEFNSGALTAGLRGTYRLLVDEGFADPVVPGDADGDLLDVSLTLGARF